MNQLNPPSEASGLDTHDTQAKLRAIICVPIKLPMRLPKDWEPGFETQKRISLFTNLNSGFRRMKTSVVGYDEGHPLLRNRYVFTKEVTEEFRFPNFEIHSFQLLKVQRSVGILAIRISTNQQELPNQARRLRLLGQKHVQNLVESLGLEVVTNPDQYAFTIVQSSNIDNQDPDYHAPSNLLQLRTKTFDDHQVHFLIQTMEFALLVATKMELIRMAESILGSGFWRMRTVSQHRKLLWNWFIQDEPGIQYARVALQKIQQQRNLDFRLQNVLRALDSKTSANSGLYLFWLTLLSGLATIGSFYVALITTISF